MAVEILHVFLFVNFSPCRSISLWSRLLVHTVSLCLTMPRHPVHCRKRSPTLMTCLHFFSSRFNLTQMETWPAFVYQCIIPPLSFEGMLDSWALLLKCQPSSFPQSKDFVMAVFLTTRQMILTTSFWSNHQYAIQNTSKLSLTVLLLLKSQSSNPWTMARHLC